MHSPLKVLNAFAIRADSQPPEGLRRARPGYAVNRAGEGIEDPGTASRVLALTDRPQLEWEAFDEYWRKVHGPKILHEEGADDRQTPRLAYYLQQHRIPAGPTSLRPPPYRVALTPDGRLPGDPASRCEPCTRVQWDGIAQLGFHSRSDLEIFFDAGPGKYGDKIMPDEAVFIRGFGFHIAEEHEVIPGNRRRDPIVLVMTHARLAADTREVFRGRWMAQFAGLVRTLARDTGLIRRYAQLVNVSRPEDSFYDAVGDGYDGVSVLSFASMNDVEDFLADAAGAALLADVSLFTRESAFFTTLNYVIRDTTA